MRMIILASALVATMVTGAKAVCYGYQDCEVQRLRDDVDRMRRSAAEEESRRAHARNQADIPIFQAPPVTHEPSGPSGPSRQAIYDLLMQMQRQRELDALARNIEARGEAVWQKECPHGLTEDKRACWFPSRVGTRRADWTELQARCAGLKGEAESACFERGFDEPPTKHAEKPCPSDAHWSVRQACQYRNR